jgi:hypothetical protein
LTHLNALPNAYAFKFHGSGYHVGQPDIFGCVRGRFVVIEDKRAGERSRPVQRAVQALWRRAGAVVVQDATCWEDVRVALADAGLLLEDG